MTVNQIVLMSAVIRLLLLVVVIRLSCFLEIVNVQFFVGKIKKISCLLFPCFDELALTVLEVL